MFCPTGTMMQGKSSLNADAAPYIPISKNSSDGDSKSAKGVSEKSEGVGLGEAAIRQLHDNVSLGQSLEKLDVSDESSSVMVQYFETSVAEKQSMTDDTSIVIDFLMSRFPGYCAESLSEFLNFNNGDVEDTIDLLEEFETERVESPGTSEIRHAPTSQNCDISCASGSTTQNCDISCASGSSRSASSVPSSE